MAPADRFTRLIKTLQEHDWQPESDTVFSRENLTVELVLEPNAVARVRDFQSSVTCTPDGACQWVIEHSAKPRSDGLSWWADFDWVHPDGNAKRYRVEVWSESAGAIRCLKSDESIATSMEWDEQHQWLVQSAGYTRLGLLDPSVLDSLYRAASDAIRLKRGLPRIP